MNVCKCLWQKFHTCRDAYVARVINLVVIELKKLQWNQQFCGKSK